MTKHAEKKQSFKDATRPFVLHVTQEDIDAAVPRDGRNCVLSRAGQREHGCFDILIHRTVAYVRMTERSIPIRYQVTEATRDVLIAFDASGRARPVKVTLVPPRPAISKAYLQSQGRKDKIKASRTRSKARQEAVGRRRYSKPDPLTLFGVRNGSGSRPLGRGKLR
jgi:hypothetical protein